MNPVPKGRQKEWVAILDFGSQYTQLIARRVRECRVYSEILAYSILPDQLLKNKPEAIILSGGPATVTSNKSPICHKGIFELGIPILGICYGMQLMGRLLGGEVKYSTNREYGRAMLKIVEKGDLFYSLGDRLTVWMSHADRITKLPPGFEVIGRTKNSAIAAIRNKKKKIYGVQFHPEVVHTPKGNKILKHFLFRIANCSGNWTMSSFLKQAIKKIKAQVGNEKVICALSGGVDSSVLSVLLSEVVGRRLICVFINNGLLRKDEPEWVIRTFKERFHINLRYVDAEERFLKRLKGVMEPEEKRRVIGSEFIKVFEEEAKRLGKVDFLAQGTLYPDVIESHSPRGGPSATIKTHHNVGGLPGRMRFRLIEPLRELFKDEVRMLGKEMGLPTEIIFRQPFPGPGLAVRIIGEVTEERLNVLRETDAIVIDEIEKAGLYREIWQSFAILLPVKTVGVMGDERTYENVVAIRAVTSKDGMTADWVKLPYTLLGKISNRIINEVKGVNRAVYDVSSKPPSTIEWE